MDKAAPPDAVPAAHRGSRLGLPASGSRSLAPTGLRLGAFVADAIASALIAGLFVQIFTPASATHDLAARLPGSWSVVPFAVDYVFGVVIADRTLGMYLFGLRVIRVDRRAAVGLPRAALRTCLLMLLVPALVWDRDGRGLHDRLADTAVVRA
ncbi:MAG: RDD family protein [Jatrophihabitans sp.]|nr:MAG: RDD family protein [Jatrophihabitans sp.]